MRDHGLYLIIEEMLEMVEEPNRSGCQALLRDNRTLFQQVQGSTHNHQNWSGGYFDHVQEAMNIAVMLYSQLSGRRPLPFNRSDLLLVVFLHDLEKPWRFELGKDGELRNKPELDSKAAHHEFRMRKIAEYGISLTPEHINGLKYVEGEIHDYSSRERKMSPLAAVAHMCDVCSARVWFDRPLLVHDSWQGARRIRD